MKKKSLFLIAMLLCIGVAEAGPVGIDKARTVALNYLKKADPANAKLTESNLVDISSTTPFREFYDFTVEPKGFILVAGDDCVQPILGYSTTNTFASEGMPEHVKKWLEGYEIQIRSLRTAHPQLSPDIASQWDLLIEGLDIEWNGSPANPLLTTTWAQGSEYNYFCPVRENNEKCLLGPVAVAMAQVMRYWGWPQSGTGIHTYPWNGTVILKVHITIYGRIWSMRSILPVLSMRYMPPHCFVTNAPCRLAPISIPSHRTQAALPTLLEEQLSTRPVTLFPPTSNTTVRRSTRATTRTRTGLH